MGISGEAENSLFNGSLTNNRILSTQIQYMEKKIIMVLFDAFHRRTSRIT